MIDFPVDESGRRSSASFGRHVVADALRVADPAAADATLAVTDWRRGYLGPFRALMSAGLPDGYDIAAAGLASVRSRMPVEIAPPSQPFETITVDGDAPRETEVVLPYRGQALRGAELLRRLEAWTAAGVIEQSCADAVREVAANPDWLDLSDQRLVMLGAGAEMGPLPAVLAWGGTVVAVDLPRVWERVAAVPGAGRLIAPVRPGRAPGADLLAELGAVAHWLEGIEGRLVLGNYVYAPGPAYAKLSVAVDALAVRLRERRDDVALAFLATPTDVFAVPPGAVALSRSRFESRSRRARVTGALSGGRLLQPNYAGEAINDSLVPQQGPNYALAKRIQRWRASVTRREGVVSFAVAPPTRTRSVTSNRLLAAAYAGAHLFDVEIFEPATANRLMALLLVHQLRKPRPAAPAAWQDEAVSAAHGGLWTTAYRPRTALGLAAVRGLVTSR
ncbi:hypothetical protein [Paractinoplanes brasiliensis]|uniref:Uncharacterized protein n=1 Tax=Paractinoplanes brasiliensis TaxID=52695 RepID=A0A4R6JWN4_9ACTN|nr:hypothetical protein [Actinoplanes brasiliensis]TDO41190.1 hypothetical protein C8E87_4919 [Actinoplanes brasiliensis]GID26261.1 hypothetical protein Abr02nite_12440 [Actinoplanes brasiliensis]